jgi:glycosyltransferase involved in cell wall biosynthesis
MKKSKAKVDIKVSVIVPVHNVEKFLRQCLDTLISQTLAEIEIICVNDGSSDGSGAILDEYAAKDGRIVVVHQENLGQSVARNRGMDLAKGEYIGFVDSDDWVDLNYFEKLYDVAKKYDADISCCSFFRVYPPSSRVRKKVVIAEEGVFESVRDKYRITDTPRMCHVFNKIYRRSVLEKLGLKFRPGIFFEDIPFSIRAIFFMKKLAVTPKTRYHYRANNDSILRGEQTDKKQHDLIQARRDFIDFAREHFILCDDKYFIQEKILHKFLGVPIMKIYVWETIRKYYLFGLIKIWETRHSL